MGLLTEYPLWFLFICMFLGAIYAFLLYFRANRKEVNTGLLWFMSMCRFLVVFLISFLLLSPLIRRNITTIEKPVIIIGQDNSESIRMTADSEFYRTTYPALLDKLGHDLRERYEVRIYSFGDRLNDLPKTDFTEKSTDISRFFTEVENRYLNRNVGAVILASDGIYNYGNDPFHTIRSLPYKVYTIALGDTTDIRDLKVTRLLYNQKVFAGDKFPVEIQVDATKCEGESATLRVMKDRKVVQTREFPIRGKRFSRQIEVLLEAGQPGWHKYSVELSPLEGEENPANNKREFYIEVKDTRTKITLVYDAPHPDIGAIRAALETNRKYDIREQTIKDYLNFPDTASLVVFYQVPSAKGTRLQQTHLSKLPSCLFILGSQSDLQDFNSLDAGLSLSSSRSTFSEAYPVVNGSFPFFVVDPSIQRLFPEFPPLQSPFATYQYSPLTEVLCFQKINGVSTRLPLICFIQQAGTKRAFICGENFWRWRISAFLQSGDHRGFDEIIQKIIQYLSVKVDTGFFRINGRLIYLENEFIELSAELYNQSYELINEPDIELVITDETGNSYPFIFSQTGNSYFLNAGSFPPGEYHYRAAVTSGEKKYVRQGHFIISPVNLEAINLKADHNLLFRLANSHNGEMVFPTEMDSLTEMLKKSRDIHAVSYTHRIFTELISTPWIFLLILGLLTGEWLIRKYTGL